MGLFTDILIESIGFILSNLIKIKQLLNWLI
jgi:hypothetical protein